jgi:predicted Zn-dependent protease
LLLAACASLPPAEGPLRPWQVAVLREHAERLRGSESYIEDAALYAYVREWLRRIDPLAANQLELFVLDLPARQADLVAGRLLRLRSGLLRALQNEAELAFVLAHELAPVTLGHTALQLSGQFDALAAEIAADAAAQQALQRLGLHPQAGVELLLRLRRDDAVAAEQAQLRQRLEALMPLVPQICLLQSAGDQTRFDALLAPYRR